MNATIRGLKGLMALGALAGLGLLLHWVTAGSIEAATTQDLISMASVAIGAVAWVAYCWLVVAVLATVLEQVPGAIGHSASLVAGRITSQGSRTLLRSALGVAAVTPLTIGVAHATPGHTFTTHQSTTTPGTRPWDAVEPQSTLQLHPNPTHQSAQPRTQPVHSRPTAPQAGSRPWSAVEPQSTVEISDDTPLPSTSGGSGSVGTTGTSGIPAGSRPWSSVEPRSSVEVTDETPADWRATEKPSSIQLGVPNTPATTSQANATQTPQPGTRPGTQSITKPISPSGTKPGPQSAAKPGSQSGAKPASPPSTGKTEQRTQPAARSGAVIGKQTPAGPSAVPDKTGHATTGRTGAPAAGNPTTGRTGVPETGRAGAGRSEVSDGTERQATGRGGEVAVPDRPTSGAPTRYTHLQSGRLARAASHVVKPGDSLWTIAAAELGSNATEEAIAARWPQWYEANRQLIGLNPNLIIPGQVLNPPAPTHPVPPTHQEK